MGPDEKCFKLTIVVRVGVWGVVIFLYIADNAVHKNLFLYIADKTHKNLCVCVCVCVCVCM